MKIRHILISCVCIAVCVSLKYGFLQGILKVLDIEVVQPTSEGGMTRALEGLLLSEGSEQKGNRTAVNYMDPLASPLTEGTHHYPGPNSESASGPINTPLATKKVLLYITTHMSELHSWYLKTCWPLALNHSFLLNSSDVAIYLNPKEEQRKEATDMLRDAFHNQNLTIHIHGNHGKQTGAMAALSDATKEGYFAGYDWVIRVNPDVIIRDESFMLDVIQNDENATGLLIDCKSEVRKKRNPKAGIVAHTDFFAIKPSVLAKDAFIDTDGPNAEAVFTQHIKGPILDQGGQRWIPNTHPLNGQCRAGVKRKRNVPHVIHIHPNIHSEKDRMKCPIPFS